MKIYRIDGNRVGNEPLKGFMGYYINFELAYNELHKRGYYLEERKWEGIGGHEPNTKSNIWYSKMLSDDGYAYDNTSYAFISEVTVIDGIEIDVKDFKDFTKEEYQSCLKKLGVEFFKDLVGKKCYYSREIYGLHKILKWNPDTAEYLLELDGIGGGKFWTNPFRIIL